MLRDPFRRNDYSYLNHGYFNRTFPHEYNTRQKAVDIFNQALEQSPMFGLEQEFFFQGLIMKVILEPLNRLVLIQDIPNQGEYYCSVGYCNAIGRNMMEEALNNLNDSDININEMNV